MRRRRVRWREAAPKEARERDGRNSHRAQTMASSQSAVGVRARRIVR